MTSILHCNRMLLRVSNYDGAACHNEHNSPQLNSLFECCGMSMLISATFLYASLSTYGDSTSMRLQTKTVSESALATISIVQFFVMALDCSIFHQCCRLQLIVFVAHRRADRTKEVYVLNMNLTTCEYSSSSPPPSIIVAFRGNHCHDRKNQTPVWLASRSSQAFLRHSFSW